jgi:large subunit ribosomal protein L2
VVAGEKVDVKPGNAMPLRAMPVGTIVHNIELKPGQGRPDRALRRRLRPALGRDAGYARSPELGRSAHGAAHCMATVGAVSNPDHMNEVLGKAGRNVWKGRARTCAAWP